MSSALVTNRDRFFSRTRSTSNSFDLSRTFLLPQKKSRSVSLNRKGPKWYRPGAGENGRVPVTDNLEKFCLNFGTDMGGSSKVSSLISSKRSLIRLQSCGILNSLHLHSNAIDLRRLKIF